MVYPTRCWKKTKKVSDFCSGLTQIPTTVSFSTKFKITSVLSVFSQESDLQTLIKSLLNFLSKIKDFTKKVKKKKKVQFLNHLLHFFQHLFHLFNGFWKNTKTESHILPLVLAEQCTQVPSPLYSYSSLPCLHTHPGRVPHGTALHWEGLLKTTLSRILSTLNFFAWLIFGKLKES